MKKSSRMFNWFQKENAIIQLTIVCAGVIIAYSAISSFSKNDYTEKANSSQAFLQECDWSIDQSSFHTEGVFKDGSLWQISSLEGKFYRSDYGNGKNKRVQLKDYQEAVKISNKLLQDGYGCDCYDY